MGLTRILPVVLLTAACASSKNVEQKLTQLEARNAALRLEQGASQQRIEDLSNSMMVLRDRVETLKLAVESRPKAQPSQLAPTRTSPKTSAPRAPKRIQRRTSKMILGSKKSPQPFLAPAERSVGEAPPTQFTNTDLDQMEERIRVQAGSASPPGDEDPAAIRIYNDAFRHFTDEKYPQARESLEKFVGQFPQHAYADNAVFWIGESYFRGRSFAEAAEQFERVAKDFPSGNKVPDALLKAGSCYLRMSKPKVAQTTFRKIVDRFPQSIAARKAREWIAELSDSSQGRM